MSITVPRTEAERAGRAEQLLADIADVIYDPSNVSFRARGYQVRRVLLEAGYHPGQVDADGAYVPPPHDDCRECEGARVPAPLSNAGIPSRLGPPAREAYPLAEAAGSGHDGDNNGHQPLPTAFCPACDGRLATATCSTCGGRLVWRFGAPDPRTATPRGAYEHAEVPQ